MFQQNFVPLYSFRSQVYAMFLRQYKMTVRNWQAWIMFLLPILLIFIGVYLIGYKFFKILDE